MPENSKVSVKLVLISEETVYRKVAHDLTQRMILSTDDSNVWYI